MSGGRQPADRRLFGFAAGLWLASLTALPMPPARAAACAALVAGAALSLVGLQRLLAARESPVGVRGRDSLGRRDYRARHRRAVVVWPAVAALLGAVCGLAATAARTASRDAPLLAALAQTGAPVRAEAVVTGDPRRVGPAVGPATVLVPVRLAALTVIDGDRSADGTPVRLELDARVLVFGVEQPAADGGRPAGWSALLPSQRLMVTGRLASPRGDDLTAAVLTADEAPTLLGSPQWTQLAAGSLRAGLRRATEGLPAEPGGLLPGLVVGDTSQLDPALEEDFRATGLTHLMAVSGANVAIVVGLVLLIARWSRAGPWLAAGLCLLALAGFVILVRPSPSVLRAAAMGAIGLLALATGRHRIATAALATAVIASLLLDPALAVSAGFTLSVLATAALVLLAPRWRDALRAHGVPAGLAEALAVPAAAQLACAPVIAAISGQVSLIAVPANLLAAPAVAPATVLGVGTAVLSPLWPAGAATLAWLASWPARWLVLVAHAGAKVPVGSLPWTAGWRGALALAAATAAVWFVARRQRLRRVLLVAALALAAGVLPVRWFASGWPPAGAVLVACDVGQGDALVLPEGTGSAVVVDTGPDPVAVDGCLRRLGVRAVSLVVITHFHLDHIDGLAGVLRGRAVGAIVVPAFAEPPSGEASVRSAASAAGVQVTPVGPGWSYARGTVQLRAIAPVHALHGTRSDPNNNSVVLLAHVRGVAILLPGDAEVQEQQDLVRDVGPAGLRVDVLKVAHHGSSYQDSELLDATEARVALVSVGAGNPYGHPSAGVLTRLAEHGARVLRTDLDGELAVVLTPTGLGVVMTRTMSAAGVPGHPRSPPRTPLPIVGAGPAEGLSVPRLWSCEDGRRDHTGAAACDRRRGISRRAGGRRRGREGSIGRTRHVGGRVDRRGRLGRRPPGGAEPRSVRRRQGGGHPRWSGRP